MQRETQYRLTTEVDKKDRIDKLVEQTEKQLEQRLLPEGLLNSAMKKSQTINKAHHSGILLTLINLLELDDEEENHNSVGKNTLQNMRPKPTQT